MNGKIDKAAEKAQKLLQRLRTKGLLTSKADKNGVRKYY